MLIKNTINIRNTSSGNLRYPNIQISNKKWPSSWDHECKRKVCVFLVQPFLFWICSLYNLCLSCLIRTWPCFGDLPDHEHFLQPFRFSVLWLCVLVQLFKVWFDPATCCFWLFSSFLGFICGIWFPVVLSVWGTWWQLADCSLQTRLQIFWNPPCHPGNLFCIFLQPHIFAKDIHVLRLGSKAPTKGVRLLLREWTDLDMWRLRP